MKTQLPSKYPWKSSRDSWGFAKPSLRNTNLGVVYNSYVDGKQLYGNILDGKMVVSSRAI